MGDVSGRVAVYDTGAYTALVFAGMACMGLAAGFVPVALLLAGGPVLFTLAFLLFWFPFWARLAYAELFLVADTLATDGEVLRWRGLRRRGVWSLPDIRSVRRGGLNRQYLRVETRTGERLFVRPRRGWLEFAALIADRDGILEAPPRLRLAERSFPFVSRSSFAWRDEWPAW